MADHGTPGRYKAECRCRPCVDAETARIRRWEEGRRSRGGGCLGTYRLGCRCTDCKAKVAAAQRARRARLGSAPS